MQEFVEKNVYIGIKKRQAYKTLAVCYMLSESDFDYLISAPRALNVRPLRMITS